jgi:chorismate synthase
VFARAGTEKGITLGTPIGLFVRNKDMRPHDYGEMSQVPRPSHADFTYQMKYGFRAASGGGRASARETIGRVAAGAIAEKWLKEKYNTELVSWVSSVGDIVMDEKHVNLDTITRDDVDQHMVRCPHVPTAEAMKECITAARADEDSIGGVCTIVMRNVPIGLGEPCFDKLEAKLAHAMMSIPATKGFEIGSGFEGTKMRGSVHNDMFEITPEGKMVTKTNYSGGVQGGISNGMNIVLRIAFKPPATIGKAQPTADFTGAATTLEAKGRHDPCVVPRAIPIIETMCALVLADMCLIQEAKKASAPPLPKEIAPYFCDPSMDGSIAYNGVKMGFAADDKDARKAQLAAKKAELEAQLAEVTGLLAGS